MAGASPAFARVLANPFGRGVDKLPGVRGDSKVWLGGEQGEISLGEGKPKRAVLFSSDVVGGAMGDTRSAEDHGKPHSIHSMSGSAYADDAPSMSSRQPVLFPPPLPYPFATGIPISLLPRPSPSQLPLTLRSPSDLSLFEVDRPYNTEDSSISGDRRWPTERIRGHRESKRWRG
jgi:hypothetical protein